MLASSVITLNILLPILSFLFVSVVSNFQHFACKILHPSSSHAKTLIPFPCSTSYSNTDQLHRHQLLLFHHHALPDIFIYLQVLQDNVLDLTCPALGQYLGFMNKLTFKKFPIKILRFHPLINGFH
jgi:hypothetical protein